jgi:hypothetical protein
MRVSLVRLGAVFLAMTTIVVLLALLHVWGIFELSGTTATRIGVTYVLLSLLLGVHALVSQARDDSPRNREGGRLLD